MKDSIKAALVMVVALTAVTVSASEPFLHEVTMVAPDILRLEIREVAIERGEIRRLPADQAGGYGDWIQVDGHWGRVIGPRAEHVRLVDRTDAIPADRGRLDAASLYTIEGGPDVLSVHRRSVPYSSGNGRNAAPLVSFRHMISVRLAAPLSEGSYRVRWPTVSGTGTVEFHFDDTSTRLASLHVNQAGFRAQDPGKIAYLSYWLPNGASGGAVNFSAYGVESFEVVDASGRSVYTGPVRLRTGPGESEVGDGIPGDFVTYVRSDGSEFTGNRSRTYVFELDFSNWRGDPGSYRLRVPGLGVSDEFRVGRERWREAARVAMAGLYHQRSGIALDGRHGYTRPEAFRPRAGTTILESRLPYVLSSEARGPISFGDGARSPWITSEPLPDAWGGYMDAGDWDRRTDSLPATSMLLDVFEMTGTRADYGTPASHEVLPDPRYQGVELPDLVDEAIWNVDFFRRMQRADGAVRGGIESENTPEKLEPSWLESQTVFAYAPDAESTFIYAAVAAKLSGILRELGETTLSEMYRSSAERAWAWAENAFQNPASVHAEQAQALDITPAEFASRYASVLNGARQDRLWAAASLYRLTGIEEYHEVVLGAFAGGIGDLHSERADAGWEYARARWDSTDSSLQARVVTKIQEDALDYLVDYQAEGGPAYRSMKHRFVPLGWGAGMAPRPGEALLLMRSHHTSGDARYLATMVAGSAHILGANQLGMSFTTGLGVRWPAAVLHADSIAAGIPPPVGITIYGWVNPKQVDYSWLFDASWSALADQVEERSIYPYRESQPLFEQIWEHPLFIQATEYTVQQTIATTAAVWSYLDSHDGAGEAEATASLPVPVLEVR